MRALSIEKYGTFLCTELVSQMIKQGYEIIFTVLFTLTKPIITAPLSLPVGFVGANTILWDF